MHENNPSDLSSSLRLTSDKNRCSVDKDKKLDGQLWEAADPFPDGLGVGAGIGGVVVGREEAVAGIELKHSDFGFPVLALMSS
jgi:hypothetical protein